KLDSQLRGGFDRYESSAVSNELPKRVQAIRTDPAGVLVVRLARLPPVDDVELRLVLQDDHVQPAAEVASTDVLIAQRNVLDPVLVEEPASPTCRGRLSRTPVQADARGASPCEPGRRRVVDRNRLDRCAQLDRDSFTNGD